MRASLASFATPVLSALLAAACSVPVTEGLAPEPLIVASPSDAAATTADLEAVLPGQFLVSVDGLDAATLDAALQGIDGHDLQLVDGVPNTWRFATTAPIDDVLEHLDGVDGVRWAEPRVAVHALGEVDDPYYVHQWNLQLLQAPTVWDRTDGSGVVVAVVDTGVAPAWDAFVNLLPGTDITGSAVDGRVDTDGHGSHVAGIIAQGANNGVGIAGLAHGATILPVRVLVNGSGTGDDVAAGIRYAVDEGADVINLSLGSFYPSAVIEEACAYAVDQGAVLVAASGNDGYLNYVSYPAAYPTTLAVGATGSDDGIAPYSNGGSTLDLVAPGGDTSVDRDGDGYADGILAETTVDGIHGFHFFQGTSMAAPHAAAAAALLLSAGAEPAEVRELLTSTAVDLGAAGFDTDFGHGRIDVLAALDALDTGTPTEPPLEGCGAERCPADLVAGDLLFTEVMADPTTCTDASGEWLELFNATDATVQLGGLVLTDASGRTGTLSDAVVQPGEHVVVGRGDAQSFCGPLARSTYGTSLSLNNGGDEVALSFEGTELARTLAWTFTTPGVSIARLTDSYDATAGTWQGSVEAWGDELASPGAALAGEEPPAAIYDLTIDQVWPGELVVSEFMANPAAASDTYGEWIEVHNTTTEFRIHLEGLVVADDAAEGVVSEAIALEPGERAVLGRRDAGSFDHPDVSPDGYYGNLALNNGGDSLTLLNAYETLDSVTWGSEGAVSGSSRELVDGSWVDATNELPSGDLGTPGF
jgi:subtilisin family serine protease